MDFEQQDFRNAYVLFRENIDYSNVYNDEIRSMYINLFDKGDAFFKVETIKNNDNISKKETIKGNRCCSLTTFCRRSIKEIAPASCCFGYFIEYFIGCFILSIDPEINKDLYKAITTCCSFAIAFIIATIGCYIQRKKLWRSVKDGWNWTIQILTDYFSTLLLKDDKNMYLRNLISAALIYSSTICMKWIGDLCCCIRDSFCKGKNSKVERNDN